MILSWTAGALSPVEDAKAYGYCLYRSKTEHPAQEKIPCGDCEQINFAPVQGTSCVDDTVDDSVIYYYVAKAVNSKGNASGWSTEVRARVPGADEKGEAAAPSAPLYCSGSPATK